MVEFLNIYLCPMLAVALLYKFSKKKLILDARFLVVYGIMCCCMMPVTKVMVIMVETFFNTTLELYSSYYTVLALIAAVIVPTAWNVIRCNVSASVEIKKIGESKRNEEKAA